MSIYSHAYEIRENRACCQSSNYHLPANCLTIIFHCSKHSIVLSTLLKKDDVLKPISNPMISEQLFSRLGANFITHEALEKGTLLGMEKRTVESTLTRWCKKGLILRVQQGKYVRNDLKDKKKNG